MSLSNPASVQMIKNIIDGTTPPEYATKATQDLNGNNIAATYAKRISGTNGFEAGGGSGSGQKAVSIGNGATASGSDGISIGTGAFSGLISAISIGKSSNAPAPNSIAIGTNAEAAGSPAIAIGESAVVQASGAVQIGTGTNSNGNTLQFRDTQIVNANGELTDINTYSGSEHFSIKNPNTRTTSSDYFSGIFFNDSTGKTMGKAQSMISTDGLYRTFLDVYSSSGDWVDAMGIETDSNGSQNYTRAYAPKANSTNGNDTTIVTLDCLYPSTILALNSQASGTFQYRGGKTYTIQINTSYANTSGSYFRISRVSNIVFVSGSISVKNATNTTTNYIIYSGLPANANGDESVMAPFVSNNALEGIVKVDANGQLMFKLEKTGVSASSGRIIFGFSYVTNEN